MKYGLIGEHLGHSYSREIHAQVADYDYELCEVAPEELDSFLRKAEFRAINVTIPYKQSVIPYLDEISDRARSIGAVNTVVNTGGRLYGDNTDFAGMAALAKRIGIDFKGKKVLFLGYIATIAVPWQAYMVPQFMMMRSWGLNNTHLAIICLQAFSAFGVFMMKQFYEGVPSELCEAARIDGLSEYGIWFRIMLPLSKPALSTLTIFTFVSTWNDFLGPLIYLTKTELKTIQIGLRMFISQYSAEYGLIMAASFVALIPVLIVFLSLQKYFVQGVASAGLKG